MSRIWNCIVASGLLLAPVWAQDDDDPVGPRPPVVRADTLRALGFAELDNGCAVRVDAVPGASHVSVVLGVPCGPYHDPQHRAGMARVVERLLRRRLPKSSPTTPSGVTARGPGTMLALTVARADLRSALEILATVLDAGGEVRDDDVLRARGGALLRADDELAELPGPILRARALATVFGSGAPQGRAPGGRPDDIRAITPAAVREHLAAGFGPRGAFLIVLGGLDAGSAGAAVGATVGAVENPRQRRLSIPRLESAAVPDPEGTHLRVSAPFLTVACRAPIWGEAGFLPFLLAVEVLRGRALRTFRSYRGRELDAGFPFVSYDALTAPGLLTINRRGRDGYPKATVRKELESFLAGVRAGGTQPTEIASVLTMVDSMLRLPPFDDAERELLVESPVMLHNRAARMGFYAQNGWPPDLRRALGKVTVFEVQRELARVLAPDRLHWLVLDPASDVPTSTGR